MADLWRTRLIWAAIGAAAAVAAIRIATPAAVVAPAPVTATAPTVTPNEAIAAAPQPATAEPAVAPPRAETPTADASPTLAPPQTAVVQAGEGPSPTSPRPAADATPPPEQPTPTAPATRPRSDAPEYPLPRMPGMSNLRRSDRYDEDKGRWVITRASRVPAPASVVEDFYTRALEGLQMNVTRVDEPPDAAGTRRVTLKGRGKDGKAQVAIRQPAGELTTTARVIWQPGA